MQDRIEADRLSLPPEERYVTLVTFALEERLCRSTIYNRRRRDPQGFPRAIVGTRYKRGDLLLYLARFR